LGSRASAKPVKNYPLKSAMPAANNCTSNLTAAG